MVIGTAGAKTQVKKKIGRFRGKQVKKERLYLSDPINSNIE
jgi:hypothetical protein